MQDHFEITVNGSRHTVARAGVARPFLDWLREDLGLTGTKAGICGRGVCTGACAVCVLEWDGRGRAAYRAVSACGWTLPMASGREFVTVEALTSHPVWHALAAEAAGGCGYCAPGLAMTLFECYYRHDIETREDLHDAFSGHTCRCGSVRAARAAAETLVREVRERRSSLPASGAIERVRKRGPERRRLEGDAFDERLAKAAPDPGGLAYIDPEGARFQRPRSLLELLRLRKEYAGARFLAGGTGFRKAGSKDHAIISSEAVVELGAVLDLGAAWEIGASVKLTSLREALRGQCPIADEAVGTLGSRLSRNRATLGGALCAPESAGELGPAFIALGGTAILAGLDGEREVPVEEFLAAAPEDILRGEEILKAVRLPKENDEGPIQGVYRVALRKRNAPSITRLAASLALDGQGRVTAARIATGSAGSRPVRAMACEEALIGQPWNGATVRAAAQALRDEAPAFSDELATGDYRRSVTGALLQKLFFENPVTEPRPVAQADRSGGLAGSIFAAPTESVLENEAPEDSVSLDEVEMADLPNEPASADVFPNVSLPPTGWDDPSEPEGADPEPVTAEAAPRDEMQGTGRGSDASDVPAAGEGDPDPEPSTDDATPESPEISFEAFFEESEDDDDGSILSIFIDHEEPEADLEATTEDKPETGAATDDTGEQAESDFEESIFVDVEETERNAEDGRDAEVAPESAGDDVFESIFVDPDDMEPETPGDETGDEQASDTGGMETGDEIFVEIEEEAPEAEAVETSPASEDSDSAFPLAEASPEAAGAAPDDETAAYDPVSAEEPEGNLSEEDGAGGGRPKLPPPRKVSLEVQPRNGIVIEKEEPNA